LYDAVDAQLSTSLPCARGLEQCEQWFVLAGTFLQISPRLHPIKMRSRLVAVGRVLLVLAGPQCGLSAFLESFTTNLEATPVTSVAPLLWVTTPVLKAGGRGPDDASDPTGNNALVFTKEQKVAETVLMNWDEKNTTQLSFFVFFQKAQACYNDPVAVFKLAWSNDSMAWSQQWNYTAVQLTDSQWVAYKVNLPVIARAAPVAFKWTLTVLEGCPAVWLDDITFPTVAPSADTYLMGKAPKAPMPSPSVCAAILKYCDAEKHAPTEQLGGRRLMSRHA
jgi:hypothetical protein